MTLPDPIRTRRPPGRVDPPVGSADLAEPDARPLRPGVRTLLLIVGFWTLWGLSMAASLLLSPAPQQAGAPFDVVAFSLIGAYTWAALTLPLFSLTSRIDLESGRRVLSYVALLALALLLAVIVSAWVPLVSSLFLREFESGRYSGPGGLWNVARYRFSHDLLAALLVLAAGVARHYFLRYRARQEEASVLRAQLYESRLQVLRAQLNPHFLFNTLNAVAALVAEDPKGVRRMIARLSGLLRYTLEGASEAEIPVAKELEMIERYLEILEIRFQGRLETRITSEPSVAEALVPNLILQPLAENAIKHGVSLTSQRGRIRVDVRRDDQELVLSVTDTGAVDDRGSIASDRDGPGGFGLRHTRDRLQQLYGSGGRLRLTPTVEGGMRAEVRLPFHTRRSPAPIAPAAQVDIRQRV